MNNVTLIGRLTDNPEVRYSQGGEPVAVARYRLAVDRPYKKEGEQSADFISCCAFGKNGEFAEKYLTKGMKVAIVGRIQTGSYTNKEGNKVYTTDVVVNNHYFCESKTTPAGTDSTPDSPAPSGPAPDGYMDIPTELAEDLPFK